VISYRGRYDLNGFSHHKVYKLKKNYDIVNQGLEKLAGLSYIMITIIHRSSDRE